MGERKKYIDCSELPSDSGCTVRISGKEEEVLPLAVHHAITVLGHKDTSELREQLKQMLKDE